MPSARSDGCFRKAACTERERAGEVAVVRDGDGPVALSPGFIFSAVRMAEPALLLLCERLPAVNVLFGLADEAVNVAPEAITAAAAIMTTTIGSIRSSR